MTNVTIVFRVDASIEVGSGHVMRCLTLAEQFKEKGYYVEFICRQAEGSMEGFIHEKGFKVNVLPKVEGSLWMWTTKNSRQDAEETKAYLTNKNIDLVVVDHYSIDEVWEKDIRHYTKKIMVIDDLANRKHQCDLLLDQNYFPDLDKRYQNLIPENAVTCLGPNYVLLRKDFFSKYTKNDLRTIFVFFGSMDRTNETTKVLKALKKLESQFDFKVIVVVGQSNPYKDSIQEISLAMNDCEFYCQVENMAELMSRCQFFIGAGGTITWERAMMRLPGVIITVADNQKKLTEALYKKEAIGFLGDYEMVSEQKIILELKEVLKNPDVLKKWEKNMNQIFDRKQVIEKPLMKNIERILLSC